MAATADHVPPQVPGYRVYTRLGEGAMGEVWAAESSSGRPVAIKLMRRSVALDRQNRRRFLRESRAVASLDHPGIVDVIEVGATAEDRPYIVMERLEGETLRDHIARRAPLPWVQARDIVRQLALALGAAHDRGLVHRDVKPANVMLVADGDRVHCTVIDFGLARHLEVSRHSTLITVTGQLLGTPAYMSPETLGGAPAGPASDQYALGCIAYEMLAGKRPYPGEGLGELLGQHLGASLPRPELPGVARPLQDQVWALLRRCLCKRPEHRFAGLPQLVRALDDVGPQRPPVSVPDEAIGAGPWPMGHVDRDPTSARRGSTVLAGARSSRALAVTLGALVVGGFALAIATSDAEDPPTASSRASTPLDEGPMVAARDLIAGVAFSCALSEHAQVQCWGADSQGRLGRGTQGTHVGDNEHPVQWPALQLPAGRRPIDLSSSADARHACVVFDDRRARCWGQNFSGQLGLGTIDNWGDDDGETVSALDDLPIEGIVRVVTGAQTTCALLDTGDAQCWGAGRFGIRGDGRTDSIGDDERLVGPSSRSKVDVGDHAIVDLAIGNRHACALLDSGDVRCWGSHERGQLGVGDWAGNIGDGVGDGRGLGERPDDPELAVLGLDDVEVVRVYAAADRSCVLTAEQGVRCWGADAPGVLGYGPELELPCAATSPPGKCDLAAPPPLDLDFGEATIVDLSLGETHGCALDDEGAVRCWGHAAWGRTGNGDAVARPSAEGGFFVPSELPSARIVDLGDADGDGHPDRVEQLAASNMHTCARMRLGGVRCWGRGLSGRLGYASGDGIGDDEVPAAYFRAQQRYDVRAFGPP